MEVSDIERRLAITLIALCCAALLLWLQPADLQAQADSPVRVLASDTSHVILELNLTSYGASTQSIDGATYTVLSVPGAGQTSQVGKPKLPIMGVMLGIPSGAQAALKILNDDVRRDTLAYPPVPAPSLRASRDPRQILSREPTPSYNPDASAYSANQWYPAAPGLIAGTGNWRSQRYLKVEFNPFQYNPVGRQLLFHQRLRVEITFSYPQGIRSDSFGAPLDEGPFESVLRSAVANYDSARNWRAKNPVSSSSTRRPSAYSSVSPWYKIAVNSDGMYKVSCANLAAAGMNPATLDPGTLQLFKQGIEMAIYVAGDTWNTCSSNNYLEFFGQGIDQKYTDTNFYWLTYGVTTGLRMPSRDGGSTGFTPAPSYVAATHLEQNLTYVPILPASDDADHWYWSSLYPAAGRPSADFVFETSNLTSGAVSATVQSRLLGYTYGRHHTQTFINGHLIDDSTWSGAVERQVTVAFDQSFLVSGSNTLRVTELNDMDPGDAIYVDNFDIRYTSAFTATANTIRFSQPQASAWQYQVSGFTSNTVETFDITNPYNVTRFQNTKVTPSGPSFTLGFADSITSPREYLATTQPKSPLSIARDSTSSLRNAGNGADYIVISYGGFLSNIQPLASYRASQGLRVRVVDVQDVYDEFNDGSVDPRAIRDFLAYAYTNWQPPAPSFVLLVGQGTIDPRGYCTTPGVCQGITTLPNSSLLPPYLRYVDPYGWGETASDNRLVSFQDGSGNLLPMMAIGRLPALAASDVDAMVAKIVNYERQPAPGDWRTKFGFVADNAYDEYGNLDLAGNFWALSDAVASNSQYVPAPFRAERIYYNPCTDTSTYPQCALPYTPYPTADSARSAILSAINNGRLILNFIGHANYDFWADEYLFQVSDVSSLMNAGKLPVILSMTCKDGYFIFPGWTSLAEAMVRQPVTGALASWSPSGQGLAGGHDLLDRGFFQTVVQPGLRQIGLATIGGKTNLWVNGDGGYNDLMDTFNLFGDPASRLAAVSNLYLPFIRK